MNIARQFQLTRDEQDEFAMRSQNRAEAAQVAGRFKDEVFTANGRRVDTIVDADEYIQHGAEANEAFAAQARVVNEDLGWNHDTVNVNGGALAIGHPFGASGARVLNCLLCEMKRDFAKKGLATLCIGGGMGIAICVEDIREGKCHEWRKVPSV